MGEPNQLHKRRKTRRRPLAAPRDVPNKLWNKIALEYHMHMQQSGQYAAQYQLMKKLRAHLGGRMLEVGCGAGEVAKYILANPNKSFSAYLGVDTSKTMVELATRNLGDFALLTKRSPKTHAFEVGSIQGASGRFDTILAFNSFCYVDAPGFLASAAALTGTFGKLIVGEEDPLMSQGTGKQSALRGRSLFPLSEIRKIVESEHFAFEHRYVVPINEKHNLVGMVFGKKRAV